MNKITAIASAAAMSLSLTVSANVVTIDFESQAAPDGSNLISSLLDFDNENFNQLGLPGGSLFWEDFDVYSNGNYATGTRTGCGFTQLAPGIDLGAAVTGSYDITQGLTSGQAAPPAGDDTCFLVTPRIGGAAPGSVDFGLGSLLTSNGGFELDYLGLYWGSIDGTNSNMDSIQFFDANDDAMSFQYWNGVAFTDLGNTITGAELLSIFQGQSGNQSSSDSNLYVNFYMENNGFKNFALTSTGKALEIDNIVARTRPVPTPGTLALFGLSLIGLALGRNKTRK